MLRIIRLTLLPAAFALLLPIPHAQQSAPPAPVPAAISSAHRVFIANGGMDAFSLQAFQELSLSGTNA